MKQKIYLITGLMASGKSTVSDLLAKSIEKCVHLRGDVFRKMIIDYSGRSAHALKRVQRTGIAVQQSSAAVQPRPLGMG